MLIARPICFLTTLSVTALALIIALSLAADAHKGATGIVKQRMDAMKSVGASMKALAAMMRGKTRYDAAAVGREAGNIEAHAKAFPSMFPKGSSKAPSEARAEIWTRSDDFNAGLRRMETYAAGLALAAANPLMPNAATAPLPEVSDKLMHLPPNLVFRALSTTCGGCHKTFRRKHH